MCVTCFCTYYIQRIVKAAEDLPRGDTESQDFYDNYKFYNTRDRDKTIKDILDDKQRRIDSKDKQDRVNESSPFCDRPSDPHQTSSVYRRETEPCMAKLIDSLNFTVKESSVFFPLDVFDNSMYSALTNSFLIQKLLFSFYLSNFFLIKNFLISQLRNNSNSKGLWLMCQCEFNAPHKINLIYKCSNFVI